MLTQLSIENFRLFKQLHINDLAPVNLIVGKNNVGKTSLLDALYLLVSPDDTLTMLELLTKRGEYFTVEEQGERRRLYEFSHLFYGHQLDSHSVCELQAQGKTGDNQLRIFYQVEDGKLAFVNGQQQNRRYLSASGEASYFNRSRYLSEEVVYLTTDHFAYDDLAVLWNRLITTSKAKKQHVIEMLQILEPEVDDVLFLAQPTKKSGIVLSLKGQDKPVPLGSMGDGMTRILAIALALANVENGFLLVDEIDTGLHYRTITDMWALVLTTAVRLNIQVFATTHSLDCIRSFGEALTTPLALNGHQPQSLSDAGRLIRLQRRDTDIEAILYDSQEIAFSVAQEIEVR